ncbi:MAG: hypothetical protein GIW97_08530 [Candidatus Eremiobacteraeota bacterium]|nr:hypothetical protein [Candidatus Eremiobacteraeota bacterium]
MTIVYTIGVYGSDKERFFAAITSAGIDIFLDVRRRRGVRGPLYPFANAKRLTAELHATRAIQYAADDRAKERKSERRQLARELKDFRAPVLCCVERYPQGCHRGLAARLLAAAMNATEVVQLFP